MTDPHSPSVYPGFIPGIVLSLAVNLDFQDVAKTVILTAVGGAVSFIVSQLLRCLMHYFRKK